MKYKIIFIFLVALLITTGCSFFGVELGVHRTITVEKKPYRVVMSGDIQKNDKVYVKEVLQFLRDKKFKETKMEAIKIEVYGSQSTKHIDLLDVDKSQETKEGE